MMRDFIDSSFDISYLNHFDFIVALGVCAKNIKSDIYINPLLDTQTKHYIRYEAGTEEGVAALFLCDFYKGKSLIDTIKSLDYGYLTSETNIAEEEMQEIKKSFYLHKNPLLLFGDNFYLHQRNKNILNIFSNLAQSINIAFLGNDERIHIIKKSQKNIEQIATLPENNGCIVYVDFITLQKPLLRFSSEFAKAWNINDNDYIEICFDDFKIEAFCLLDSTLSGVIGILRLDKKIDCGYRYKKVMINKLSR